MATKKYLSLERLADYDELIKAEIKSGDESTLSSAKSYADTKVSSITNGDIIVKEAEHSTSADSATNADHSVSSDSATKASQDASGNVITDTYETKEDAQLKYDTITAAKANWNQNDENAIDYIKNKPFGEGGLIEVEVFQEDSVEFIEYFGLQNTLTTNMVFPVDKQYIITFNGTRYECMSRTSTDGYNKVIIGNGTINGDDNITNGEPFEIVGYNEYNECSVYVQSEGTHTIGISVIDTEIKKIDSKYLPDMDFAGKKVGNGAEIFNHYDGNIASGSYSHAEGMGTTASGDNSHAEGTNTTASGSYSHAEGMGTTASGNFSHAEGQEATASGIQSHAEGNFTTASGENAHAEGYGTIASGLHQHAQGKYNIEDTSNTYAHIVGNGSYNRRSNAHTLDWSGNAWFKGNIKIGGTKYDDGSEVALKSDLQNIDLSKYETKTDSQSKLDEAKAYADSAASTVKNDLLNGAGDAYDTLKELGELIVENKDAIDVLEDVATGKADAVHSHAISEVSGLQSALDNKADASHGTHVSYSTTAPVMDGTASVGSASTVARSDHRHPTDTSRASQTALDSHIADSTKHITSTERTNWNAAKTHADSAHAPSNAQVNVIESIKVNGATQIITNKSVDITVPTDATDIGAAPSTHGHAISDITDLQTTLNNAANAIQTNTNSINAHTDRISSLETKVGDGFEEISSEEIAALFSN